MKEFGTKDIKISFKAHALLLAKCTELKIKTGKKVTLKGLIDNLVFKHIEKEGKEGS